MGSADVLAVGIAALSLVLAGVVAWVALRRCGGGR